MSGALVDTSHTSSSVRGLHSGGAAGCNTHTSDWFPSHLTERSHRSWSSFNTAYRLDVAASLSILCIALKDLKWTSFEASGPLWSVDPVVFCPV